VVSRFVPTKLFEGLGERQRVYTPWVTFCAFLGQVLERGASCRDAVRRVQAWHLAIGSRHSVDGATGGYCQARARLPVEILRHAFSMLEQRCSERARAADRWLGRTVKVIDGSGLSMPDTEANRERFPYAGGQKPGCGFPTGKFVGLFSWATGHLIKFGHNSWRTGESPMAQQLIGWVHAGEIVLGDRGFCNWFLISLFQRKCVDVVMRLHQARKTGTGRVCWDKPQRKAGWDIGLWREMPKQLVLRVVRFRVEVPGFRTDHIAVVTTLLDETKYSDHAIAQLYLRRWQVELNFRDLKTSMGMDILRTRTPDMIEKEIYLHAIAYNVVRALLIEASRQHDVPASRLSFKGALSTLRAFAPLFMGNRQQAFTEPLFALASDVVPLRPFRCEPRAVKRRPKVFQLLNEPRHIMRVSKSRRQK
jgi:hypothetical protein